jgi:hypothetical protein
MHDTPFIASPSTTSIGAARTVVAAVTSISSLGYTTVTTIAAVSDN